MTVLRKKIPVGILGATGSVGQKFVELLCEHPWFEIVALCASSRSEGKSYSQSCRWQMDSRIPERIQKMTVQACRPELPCQIVFSGLDASCAGEIEQSFAEASYVVISNAKNFRFHREVPLLIPEVNAKHLDLLRMQKNWKGVIVTNPNCSVIGLSLALKPIYDAFGLESCHVVSMQALSGAGYPGVASMDILDNVIPFIQGEEDKVIQEPLKILGSLQEGEVCPAQFKIQAQCNRVAVRDGHLLSISINTKKKAKREEILHVWESFAKSVDSDLPSSPKRLLYYLEDPDAPQPKRHRNWDRSMAVCLGRLKKGEIFDFQFLALSHNTVRGAAGGALLNAETMIKKGYLDKILEGNKPI